MAVTENSVHRAVIDISTYSRESAHEALEKALKFNELTVNDSNLLFAVVDSAIAKAHDKAFRSYEKTFTAYKESLATTKKKK